MSDTQINTVNPLDTVTTSISPYCPSARPGMEGSVVFGVVGEGAGGHLGYLEQLIGVSPRILELAASADPSEVFRIAAPCAESKCQHFDQSGCRLATRVARMLPVVVDKLPACRLRSLCRWWKQEGREACLRCPQITSSQSDPSELQVLVANPSTPFPRPKENSSTSNDASAITGMRDLTISFSRRSQEDTRKRSTDHAQFRPSTD
jgi:hypothetical protein